jgi:superoxide dismutase, Fe-Mn family
MRFELPELPYSYTDLEPYIDAQTMEIHHTKHHNAYVTNLNNALEGQDKFSGWAIEKLLTNLESLPQSKRDVVRNNGGGHYNHSLFWTSMKKDGGGDRSGGVATAIDKTFGDFDNFKKEFEKAGLARFGSGWVWLVKDRGKAVVMSTPNQDNPIMEDKRLIPILGLDVWEHAYYLKYKNLRGDYIKAWWNIVDWEEVNRRWNS